MQAPFTPSFADIGAGQITIAFLKAKDITVGFLLLLPSSLADLLTDKLKARQNIDRTQSIMLCDLLCHVHRYNGFDHNRICRHFMILLMLVANIIQSINIPSDSPVSNSYSHTDSLTAIPTRSQSGSVANIKSALHLLAHSIPSAIASLISRFGYGTGRKTSVGLLLLSLTTVIFVYPHLFQGILG